MKTIIALVFLIGGTAFAQTNIGPFTFTNQTGTVITNAEVVKVEPYRIIYRSGPNAYGAVKFVDLPEDLRARFGWDPEKAAAAEAAEQERKAARYAQLVALQQAEKWRGPPTKIHVLKTPDTYGYPKYLVEIEGKKKEILIPNFPAETQKYFDDISNLEAAVQTATAQVDADDSAVRAADAATPTRSRLRAVRYQRDQINRAKRRVADEKKQLSKMKSALSALQKQEKEKTTITASLTTKKYGDLEIWDCAAK